MKNKIFSISILSCILILGIFFYENNEEKSVSSEVIDELSTEEIVQIITSGVEWFKNSQESNGHFHYEYIPFLNRYVDDDNMVRQAGALYVLGEIYKSDKENKFDLEGNITSAISYFEANTIDATLKEQNFKCILKNTFSCSIGGTSLALIGILDLIEKDENMIEDYQSLIDGYKNFIVAMKKPSEGFINDFYIDEDQTYKESAFGNGEAFLALVRYYLYSKDEEIKEVIDESFEYFVDIYKDNWDGNFYLWGMAALKDLYELDPKMEYFEFVKPYTDWRMESNKDKKYSTHNKCAYIEGVVSAYSIIEPNVSEEEKALYSDEINFWLLQSKKLQIKSSDIFRIRLNFEMPQKLTIKNADKAEGGFLTDLNEPVQRIDFTQHCLSSYLQKLIDIDGKNT